MCGIPVAITPIATAGIMLGATAVPIEVGTIEIEEREIIMEGINANMKRVIFILSLLVSVNIGNAAVVNPHVKVTVDSVYICQSKSSYAYHSHVCRGLAHCTHGIIKISKAQAIKRGYKPCKICY